MKLIEIAQALREGLSEKAKMVPTRVMPDFVVKFLGFFVKDTGAFAGEVGKEKIISNDKAIRILGWNPQPASEAVVASGETLIKYGLIKS
jgi:hypothetical protein